MRPRGVQHGAVRPSERTGRRAGVHARREDGLVDMDANAPAGQAYKEAKERSRRPDDKKKRLLARGISGNKGSEKK